METVQLHSSLVVRREAYGCIVFDRESQRPAHFNADGWAVLSRLRDARATSDLAASLASSGLAVSDKVLRRFLDDCAAMGIVIPGGQTGRARIIDNAVDDLEGALSAPWSVTIYVTDRCPKTCRHCIVSSSPRASIEGQLTLSEWASAFERLRQWGVISLIITGGEPLIRKDIFDILAVADDLGFSLSLLTDFDGISAHHVERLKGFANLQYVQTSVDGATNESHDLLRGAGSFARTLRRLALFQQMELPYAISTVVHRQNIGELNDIVDLYFAYDAAALYLNPLSPYGRAKTAVNDLTLSDHQLQTLGLFYYWAVAVRGVNSGNAFWHNLQFDEAMAPDFHPFKDVPDLISTGTYVFSVGPRGDCHLDSKAKAENFLPLGNIRDNSLELAVAWRDPALTRLRRASGGLTGRAMLPYPLAKQIVEPTAHHERKQ